MNSDDENAGNQQQFEAETMRAEEWPAPEAIAAWMRNFIGSVPATAPQQREPWADKPQHDISYYTDAPRAWTGRVPTKRDR